MTVVTTPDNMSPEQRLLNAVFGDEYLLQVQAAEAIAAADRIWEEHPALDTLDEEQSKGVDALLNLTTRSAADFALQIKHEISKHDHGFAVPDPEDPSSSEVAIPWSCIEHVIGVMHREVTESLDSLDLV